MVIETQLSQQILPLIDLTSLNDTDTEANITALCKKAYRDPLHHVAAVCVYPSFVKLAVSLLADKPVKIATVANFPHGEDSLDEVIRSIEQSIQSGADEIDVVLPYKRYIQSHQVDAEAEARHFVQACKTACGDTILLKVILETGAIQDPQLLTSLCRAAILGGADFLKTSTGKMKIGATIEAAATILFAIKLLNKEVKRSVGLKVSGGIRDLKQATEYIELVQRMMGPQWLSPKTFRFGASQLLDVVLENLS